MELPRALSLLDKTWHKADEQGPEHIFHLHVFYLICSFSTSFFRLQQNVRKRQEQGGIEETHIPWNKTSLSLKQRQWLMMMHSWISCQRVGICTDKCDALSKQWEYTVSVASAIIFFSHVLPHEKRKPSGEETTGVEQKSVKIVFMVLVIHSYISEMTLSSWWVRKQITC